jgi:hypothetical protein
LTLPTSTTTSALAEPAAVDKLVAELKSAFDPATSRCRHAKGHNHRTRRPTAVGGIKRTVVHFDLRTTAPPREVKRDNTSSVLCRFAHKTDSSAAQYRDELLTRSRAEALVGAIQMSLDGANRRHKSFRDLLVG